VGDGRACHSAVRYISPARLQLTPAQEGLPEDAIWECPAGKRTYRVKADEKKRAIGVIE
jgi:hypothetical protein